ncbi:PstS family phosphate ABC transporter substrate-binding protein [Segetibacter koreensis]|uniref:PstS family phosphate ABC transporter substrate-binding protein n=1 Tax=Segetibacter koreensis TaxID=398037 RepID=UPI000374CE3D|nr:substrate-binding domain-containing protein [Segetibacter koreensis]
MIKNWKVFLAAILLFAACKNEPAKKVETNSQTIKTLYISVDESFEPVITEQVKVFESSYPDVKVVAEYKPESECIRDLQKDSTKIVIISRELSRDETQFFDQKIEYKPEFAQLAKDAVAVIVNAKNPDSVFTVNDLKQLLTGNGNKKWNVAIDGNRATSTVRYLRDSVLKGAAFGKNITGAKNSEDLINYIANTDNAVGFIGISWITNPQSTQQEQAVAKVRTALIECNKNCDKGEFAKPSQQTITFNQYPLVRGLYYVLKENYAGLGSRFVGFLSTERGQLIFKRALLVPVKMNFNRRKTNMQ